MSVQKKITVVLQKVYDPGGTVLYKGSLRQPHLGAEGSIRGQALRKADRFLCCYNAVRVAYSFRKQCRPNEHISCQQYTNIQKKLGLLARPEGDMLLTL